MEARDLLFTVLILIGAHVGEGLSLDYYAFTCPFAEAIIGDTVNRAVQRDITISAALLRMHFHDCFVEVPMLSINYSSGSLKIQTEVLSMAVFNFCRDAMDLFS